MGGGDVAVTRTRDVMNYPKIRRAQKRAWRRCLSRNARCPTRVAPSAGDKPDTGDLTNLDPQGGTQWKKRHPRGFAVPNCCRPVHLAEVFCRLALPHSLRLRFLLPQCCAPTTSSSKSATSARRPVQWPVSRKRKTGRSTAFAKRSSPGFR